MKKLKGQSFNIKNHTIGKVTFKNNLFETDKIVVTNKVPKILFGINALIMPDIPKKMPQIPIFVTGSNNINEGDIINITQDNNCNVIWDTDAKHNALFITDTCNSKCIMCPQPMPEKPSHFLENNLKIVKLLDKNKIEAIGITGGEPTLYINELGTLLKAIKKKFGNIPVEILTNGRQFENKKNIDKLLQSNHTNITYGIPLYSNVEEEHDYIVGFSGAFNQTLRGLYNLAKAEQKVEIRIVVMKQNYKNLSNIADFIYHNLPFVTHVAIMGMEYRANAEKNFDDIFIDPIDYKEHLFNAIRQFVRYDITTSVYNIPLCLLDKRIWDFAIDSISDWKKTYTDNCSECKVKDKCSGVFATSFVQSKNIKSISTN